MSGAPSNATEFMPSDTWPPDAVHEAQRLFGQGLTYNEIARRMAPRTRSGIRYILIRTGMAPINGHNTPNDAKPRKCARCRHEFLPKTPLLFTCDPCKDTKEYRNEIASPW